MATRMLIDARHPEETRVAVLKGNRIEEFDFESAEHKQIKGNIYLAKVTRVEPSLQAAFVDFGGNRHGFLAFSEIHPDYYQIPQSDREALLAEEQAAAEEEAALRAEEDDDAAESFDDRDGDDEGNGVEEIDTTDKDHVSTIEDGQVENGDDENGDDDVGADDAGGDDSDDDEGGNEEGGRSRGARSRGRGRRQGSGRRGNASRAKEMDQVREKRQELRRRYKIQDVIQRRQVLLVQVVKEERGNKGAALTTYLSLAGRYCVLMPNSSHGGGISRKISSGADRKRLKQIVSDLTLPRSMGLIVRTAGLQRTKTEIKRDFDYLARLWDGIRERTLGSSAPSMIHSDSDLIKRAIRDIYNREIEEVIVEGDEGYKAAKQFMKLLMPSHARRIKHYADPVPMFQRYGAEDQLSAMYDPMVQLKSGGYLIINPTEALVSIDINSGRSTKEHGIEQTALHTNLEAAREIARQLRLRDMAGLVVIDFIDMENNSNVRKVERAMKDALKNDRARIQVGRISGFGLMEMSRQRLRTGVLEATTRACPHCDGTGLVRTASSAGLSALRLIEDEAAKGKGTLITLYASTEAAVYLLNAKRGDLAEIEVRYGVSVEVQPEGENEGAKMRVASAGPRPTEAPKFEPIIDDDEDDGGIEDDFDNEADEQDEDDQPRGRSRNRGSDSRDADGSADDDSRRKPKRRRRGGRGRNRQDDRDEATGADGGAGADQNAAAATEDGASSEGDSGSGSESETGADGSGEKPKRRRRRGGRGRSKRTQDGVAGNAEDDQSSDDQNGEADDAGVTSAAEDAVADTANASADAPLDQPTDNAGPDGAADAEGAAEPEAKPKRRTRRKKADPVADETPIEGAGAEAPSADATESTAPEADAATTEAAPKPKRVRKRKTEPAAAKAESDETASIPAPKAPAARKAPAPKAAAKVVADPAEADTAAEHVTADPADQAGPAAEGVPEQKGDGADADTKNQRRGWWQRTFGN